MLSILLNNVPVIPPSVTSCVIENPYHYYQNDYDAWYAEFPEYLVFPLFCPFLPLFKVRFFFWRPSQVVQISVVQFNALIVPSDNLFMIGPEVGKLSRRVKI